MKRALAAVILAAVGASAGPAAAEDLATYDAAGAADAAATDARTRALDLAFSAAVKKALAELVSPADLGRRRDDLDRQILSRARLWVASFKVVAQATEGNQLKLTAAVRIDRDRLRAKLGELGIATAAAVPEPPAILAPRTATVLMRVINPGGGVAATYGSGASREIPASEAVAGVIAASGLALVAAPTTGGPARPDGDLPLDDAAARSLASGAGAQIAVVVHVQVDGAGPVRASRQTGALARARARVVTADGELLGESSALGGAYGGSDVPAINGALTRAAALAVTGALPRTGASAVGAPPPPAAPPPLAAAKGEVLVRVKNLGAWAPVAALRQQLATTAGVQRVRIARLSADEVVLAVTTGQRPDRVAAAARATPDLRARVLTEDGIVEIIAAETTP
jgi:hypothetical protein